METANYLDKIIDIIVMYGPRFVMALVVLILGLWIIRLLVKGAYRMMAKRGVDESLRPFLRSLLSITLKILLIISVMSMVGIAMTSFIAIIGAAGLALGLALSGTLQNFAGGVMILLFKPFKAGDYIDAQGYQGTVKEIKIFNTILVTPDNKTIIIPNGGLSTGAMVNYSTEDNRRVDFVFGIGYTDDIDKARKAINGIIKDDKRIMTDPEPFIAVSELADSSVNLAVRVWAKKEDYWDIFFDITEKVKKTFDAQNISIPYPQTDVHLFKDN